MASLQGLQVPEQFDFQHVTHWPDWLKRFERYCNLTGLDEEEDSKQIDLLVYCMGKQADAILASFKLPEDRAKSYKEVIEAFNGHFVAKRNITYERMIFNRRYQKSDESIDEYVTELHTLAEKCNFGDLYEEFIRDRIVAGIRDIKTTERLVLHHDLTLEKAITIARQGEQIKKQIPDFVQKDGDQSKAGIDSVQTKKNKNKTFWKNKCQNKDTPGSKPKAEKQTENHSGRCGGETHSYKQCPATRAKCHHCGKVGHYRKFCKIKDKANVQHVGEVEYDYIASVKNATETTRQRWRVSVDVGKAKIPFKIDTGADLTCISNAMYSDYFDDKKLRHPERCLLDAQQQPMNTRGYFWEKIVYRNRSKMTAIYVVDNLADPLLDGNTCEDLGIVRRTYAVNSHQESKTTFDPESEFPEVFSGLGKVSVPYKIRLKPDAVPYALKSPRRIPLPLLDEIKTNLAEMVKLGVIEPVNEPTEWCAGLVLAPKPNGSIRMCVDYVHLNKFVLRETHPMPVTENILGRLGTAKYFSKLDANHGFWQYLLDEESQLLTTFTTPYGRYKYKRLPFGISTAPEFFQKRMSEILDGLEGVQVHADDVLVYGIDLDEHDKRLRSVLQRLREHNVTLNKDKCIFRVEKLLYLGHIIDKDGVHVDENRVSAISNMDKPENISELRSLLGSVNYLARFLPNLATTARPLNDLLCASTEFVWGAEQVDAFNMIKKMLVAAPVLAWYHPAKETVLTADASSYGMGAVLQQKQDDGSFRPIAYASKTLTGYQQNWAQIEKEAFALAWACERFKDFITGIHVRLETDHKPLIPVLTTKHLDELSPKLQRIRLRLARYSYDISHVPGKEVGMADMLSRRPSRQTDDDDDLNDHIVAYVNMVRQYLPTSDQRLNAIVEEQTKDQACQKIRKFCHSGWPDKKAADEILRPYWQYRDNFTVEDGLLLFGSRIVIPTTLRQDILDRIHEGHLGIVKCRARAKASVWWPGISRQVEEKVKSCEKCIMESRNNPEPLMPYEFPKRPWERVGMDLFHFETCWYLLVTDYYSRYPEVVKLDSLKEVEVIKHLKSIFARHGTPDEVISDNGTHFGPLLGSLFSEFANNWNFVHRTSSPKFPQSNGLAESAVKIIKRCLKKSEDLCSSIQSYRATPLANGYSPAELLMGRKIRTTVPTAPSTLMPKLPETSDLRASEDARRCKQKMYFDLGHRARDLSPLKEGQSVWITDLRRNGKILKEGEEPRSYIIDTAKRAVRRNRVHLIPLPNEEETTGEVFTDDVDGHQPDQTLGEVRPEDGSSEGQDNNFRTRSGRRVKIPERLNL